MAKTTCPVCHQEVAVAFGNNVAVHPDPRPRFLGRRCEGSGRRVPPQPKPLEGATDKAPASRRKPKEGAPE